MNVGGSERILLPEFQLFQWRVTEFCRRVEREPSRTIPTDTEHRRVPDHHRRDGATDGRHVSDGSLLRLSALQDCQLPVGDSARRVHHLAQEGSTPILIGFLESSVRFTSLCCVEWF